jgi:hypothetical protein
MVTHVISIKETVILVFVRCYESLKVFILVQHGMTGRGHDLCARMTWESNDRNIKLDNNMGGGCEEVSDIEREYPFDLEKMREIAGRAER